MGCEVYANGDEIACKAGGGQVIAAFPDVCMTPPTPPAGPIPVPYPNTSFSKDMKDGSTTVMIKGDPVMLKDRSFYNTSPLGDEAATKSVGAGVVTHVITGKTYFVAWSMDVKFEGENVDRHTDLTTSNHASPAANDNVPMVNTAKGAGDAAAAAKKPTCECCGNDPHSANQAAGNSISEEEAHNPKQTGKRAQTVKGGGTEMRNLKLTPGQTAKGAAAHAKLTEMRAKCPEQVPNNPPAGPCDKYYVVTAKEKQDADAMYEALNNPTNPDRPAAWANPDVKMIAHKVPRSMGGCPVGAGNTHPVTDADCAKLDGELGSLQNDVVQIARDQPPPVK